MVYNILVLYTFSLILTGKSGSNFLVQVVIVPIADISAIYYNKYIFHAYKYLLLLFDNIDTCTATQKSPYLFVAFI